MARNTVEIIVEAIDDASRVMDQVEREVKEIRRLAEDAPDFDVDTKMAKEKIEELKREIDRLPEREVIVIDANISPALSAIMALGPAVVPILASITVAAGALAPAFGAAGAAVAGFAAVAVTNLNDVLDAAEEVEKINEKIAEAEAMGDAEKVNDLLKERAFIIGQLSKEQQRALKALTDFKAFWADLAESLEGPTIDIFTKSLSGLQSLLSAFRPAIVGSVGAISSLLDAFMEYGKTESFRSFVEWVNANAGPMIETFGMAAINVFRGLIDLMMAFTPLSEGMAAGLLDLTQRFAEWAAGLEQSQGFQQFIAYAQANGPKVMAFLSELGTLMINLVKAMAPLGPVVLEMATGFLKMVNYLLELHPAVGPVLVGILQLIGVLRLVAATATGFLALKNGVVQAGTMIKTVGGWIKTFAVGAFNILRVGLTGVVNVLRVVGTGIMTFGRIAGTWLLQAGRFFLMFARMAVMGIRMVTVTMMTNPIGLAITLIITALVLLIMHWEQVKTFLINTWNAIKTYAITIWNGIKAFFSAVWAGIKNIVSSAVTWYLNRVLQNWQTIKAITTSVWNAIKSFFSSVWNGIKSTVSSAVSAVRNFVTNAWNNIKSATSNTWNRVKSIINNVWNWIKSTLSGLGKRALEWGKNLLGGFVDGIRSMYSRLKNAVSEAAGIVADFLGWHSPTKEGPGRFADEWPVNFMDMYARQLTREIPKLTRAVGEVMNAMTLLDPTEPTGGVRQIANSAGAGTVPPVGAIRQPIQINLVLDRGQLMAVVREELTIDLNKALGGIG